MRGLIVRKLEQERAMMHAGLEIVVGVSGQTGGQLG